MKSKFIDLRVFSLILGYMIVPLQASDDNFPDYYYPQTRLMEADEWEKLQEVKKRRSEDDKWWETWWADNDSSYDELTDSDAAAYSEEDSEEWTASNCNDADDLRLFSKIYSESTADHFSQMPVELLLNIFIHLDLSSLSNITSVSRRMKILSEDNNVWKGRILNDQLVFFQKLNGHFSENMKSWKNYYKNLYILQKTIRKILRKPKPRSEILGVISNIFTENNYKKIFGKGWTTGLGVFAWTYSCYEPCFDNGKGRTLTPECSNVNINDENKEEAEEAAYYIFHKKGKYEFCEDQERFEALYKLSKNGNWEAQRLIIDGEIQDKSMELSLQRNSKAKYPTQELRILYKGLNHFLATIIQS